MPACMCTHECWRDGESRSSSYCPRAQGPCSPRPCSQDLPSGAVPVSPPSCSPAMLHVPGRQQDSGYSPLVRRVGLPRSQPLVGSPHVHCAQSMPYGSAGPGCAQPK